MLQPFYLQEITHTERLLRKIAANLHLRMGEGEGVQRANHIEDPEVWHTIGSYHFVTYLTSAKRLVAFGTFPPL